MCTYLKNMEGYKLQDLKLKGFDSIQKMFDTAFKRVEDDKETAELKQCLEIILDEEEIYMLVEKKYPLAPLTLSMMLEKKLMIDYETGVSTAQRLQRKYAKCLLLLVHNCSAEVNAASENMLEVNAASENMLEVTTASEYQVNVAS
ncbi:hypothetical protein Tco_1306803 [Tanacetum coccineum]